MKRQYVKPENTVVMIQTESIIAQSIPEGQGENAGEANSREVLISDETTIISRSALQSW